MAITTDLIKRLRDATGVSILECRKALEEADGDLEKATAVLKKRSAATAEKKSGRTLGAGAIGSYIHDGTIGAMVALSCETDFVAKNPEFGVLARELAMQVAAMNPERPEDLVAQAFIKNGDKTILDLLNEATQKFGERIEVGHFTRLSVR